MKKLFIMTSKKSRDCLFLGIDAYTHKHAHTHTLTYTKRYIVEVGIEIDLVYKEIIYQFVIYALLNTFFHSCFLDCCLGTEGNITPAPDNPETYTQI